MIGLTLAIVMRLGLLASIAWVVTLTAPLFTVLGAEISRIALPIILLMEVVGAAIATFALYRAGESSRPWQIAPLRATSGGDVREP